MEALLQRSKQKISSGLNRLLYNIRMAFENKTHNLEHSKENEF